MPPSSRAQGDTPWLVGASACLRPGAGGLALACALGGWGGLARRKNLNLTPAEQLPCLAFSSMVYLPSDSFCHVRLEYAA